MSLVAARETRITARASRSGFNHPLTVLAKAGDLRGTRPETQGNAARGLQRLRWPASGAREVSWTDGRSSETSSNGQACVRRSWRPPASRSCGPETVRAPESLGYLRTDVDEQPRDGRLLLMIAWAIWNRSQALSLADLLDLDDEQLRAVGELLAALAHGPDGIDSWLRRGLKGA